MIIIFFQTESIFYRNINTISMQTNIAGKKLKRSEEKVDKCRCTISSGFLELRVAYTSKKSWNFHQRNDRETDQPSNDNETYRSSLIKSATTKWYVLCLQYPSITIMSTPLTECWNIGWLLFTRMLQAWAVWFCLLWHYIIQQEVESNDNENRYGEENSLWLRNL